MPKLATQELLKKYPVTRRFLVGFQGTQLPAEIREWLGKQLAGVALYPRNFKIVEELSSVAAEIRSLASGPVLIGIDQEGGTRFSLPEPFTQWPSPSELGNLGDANAVKHVARAIGHELAAVGINLDFAPMLDLHLNAASPVTQVRSFGSEPHLAGRMGAAFLTGLDSAGVLGCAKHFPGHGDAQVDPHEDLPVYHGDANRLTQADLVPFAAAIAVGAPTIMTAHILLPKIDPANPASLSRKILTGTLREEMHFKGLILADDLAMGAIARRHAPGEAAVGTFAAGADIAMFCHDVTQVAPAMEETRRALEEGRLSAEEWIVAGQRIQDTLEKTSHAAQQNPKIIGCAEHHVLAKDLRDRIAKLG
ncbi:MAG TPA: glycoside hydrolase family 3 N-terminal domain-containing protein [Candidatus Acidoferrum sp.]|nr:glycoside hydrolase family 3 N-terminal domain-containing protein [Candidatus Acidoferrum sp.]